jgi:hypothetical protein
VRIFSIINSINVVVDILISLGTSGVLVKRRKMKLKTRNSKYGEYI